jgi:hypothetical protein
MPSDGKYGHGGAAEGTLLFQNEPSASHLEKRQFGEKGHPEQPNLKPLWPQRNNCTPQPQTAARAIIDTHAPPYIAETARWSVAIRKCGQPRPGKP